MLNAVLFLYKEVLGTNLPWIDDVVRVKRPARMPEVLSVPGFARLLAQLEGTYRLMASLLYGSGLRLMEVIRLRQKEVDVESEQIVVPDAPGAKDRVTPFPRLYPMRSNLTNVSVF